MNILTHLISGLIRSVRSWKWILAVWVSTLSLVVMLILPIRAGINNVLGSSMITEKLTNGINFDVVANSGTALSVFLSFFGSGFFLVIFLSTLMNVFFNGGFFTVLRNQDGKQTSSVFFGGAASNFWSYFVITLIIYLILIVLSFLIVGIPIMILQGSGSETAVIKTAWITCAILALVLPIFLLAADYARAWQAGSEIHNSLRAIGKGFSHTFRHFFSSYLVMAVILIVQVLFTLLAFKIISGLKPGSGGGIFLLFLLSQFLFIVKILLRTWRYGSVTSMFEKHQI